MLKLDLARELLEGDDNENELAMTEYKHGDDLLTPLHRLALTPFGPKEQTLQNNFIKSTSSVSRMPLGEDIQGKA